MWVVRAGALGEQEEDAIQNNVVTIGWNELPDLAHINDYESLAQIYSKTYPNKKERGTHSQMTQILQFVKNIKKGDLVALLQNFGFVECLGDLIYLALICNRSVIDDDDCCSCFGRGWGCNRYTI
jgi:hypothetical protein